MGNGISQFSHFISLWACYIERWRQIDSTRRSHHETPGRLLRQVATDTLKAGAKNGQMNLIGESVFL